MAFGSPRRSGVSSTVVGRSVEVEESAAAAKGKMKRNAKMELCSGGCIKCQVSGVAKCHSETRPRPASWPLAAVPGSLVPMAPAN